MYCHEREIVANDCPNCGKPDSARMGSSSWGHDFLCCDDKCGLELKKKLETMYSSKKYKKKHDQLYKIKAELDDMVRAVARGQTENFNNW